MQTIPLAPYPNQTVSTPVNDQYVTINLRTQTTGLYFDLLINNVPVVLGVLCLNGVKMIRDSYLGFSGDFLFIDTQGNEDPVYTGFPGRFKLVAI